MKTTLEQLENGTASEKIITLKSVFKQGKLTLQPVFDPRTRWYMGVERLSEEDKKGLTYWVEPTSKITIEEATEFNLNDPIDKMNWQWVKHSPRIATSFEAAQRSKLALFYVHVEEDRAIVNVQTASKLFDAMKYVMEDDPTNYSDRARLLGVDMKKSSPTIIKDFLLSEAKNSPKKVIDAYTGNTVSLQLLFYKGIDAGIIKSENSVYKYGTQILGVSIEASVAFLQAPGNSELVAQLESEVNPESAAREIHERITEAAVARAAEPKVYRDPFASKYENRVDNTRLTPAPVPVADTSDMFENSEPSAVVEAIQPEPVLEPALELSDPVEPIKAVVRKKARTPAKKRRTKKTK